MPLLDAADAKSDGAAYAAAAINILDGPTVNHHRLPEHAGVITDYVTLIINEGTLTSSSSSDDLARTQGQRVTVLDPWSNAA